MSKPKKPKPLGHKKPRSDKFVDPLDEESGVPFHITPPDPRLEEARHLAMLQAAEEGERDEDGNLTAETFAVVERIANHPIDASLLEDEEGEKGSDDD